MTAPQMRRRRLERLIESCSGALAREHELASQYEMELQLGRQQLQRYLREGGNEDGHYDLRTQQEAMEVRLRDRLQRRAVTMGAKLSGLERYNAQLVKVINDLRCAIQPHRQGERQCVDEGDWLRESVTKHKQDMRKALDERDWAVKQLRYLQRQRNESAAQHDDKMRALQADSSRFDVENDKLGRMDRAALKLDEEREGEKRRAARVNKLKREVHLGYLKSQLAQFDTNSKELEDVMGVRLDPARPETLRAVIDYYTQKDTLVDSLHKFVEVQVDEIERLGHETFVLRAHTLKGAAQRSKQDSSASDKAAQQAAQQAADAELRETQCRLEDGTRALCAAVEGVASAAECKLNVALQTSGCSSANIYEYLACVFNQLDDLERNGRVPPSSSSGTILDLPRDWAEVAQGLELPSTHEKDKIDWELERDEDDEEDVVRKTPAYIKWQSKRGQRDRHLILWNEQGDQRGMGARDPLSASGRPVTDRSARGFWATEGAEGSGAPPQILLGSKSSSLVPYMDEPYSPTARR